MKKTIGTPEGTRDRLFAECAACRRVSDAAENVFRRQGYCELTTPNVEYYDLITAAGHPLPQEAMMKVVDRTGKILVMRPDNTVAIGRVAATKLSGLSLPLRLYYHQTVFRSDDVNTGARSEMDQVGVELIGASGLRADLEVISLAAQALEACGLKDYRLEIGHAGYFGALLRRLDLPEEIGQELLELVEQKEFTAYTQRLAPYADSKPGKALLALPRLFGGVEVLEQAKTLWDDPEAAEVLDYLYALYEVLEQAGLSGRVQFDLGLVHTIEYYTGMVFRGYGRGAAENVLSGGRYDKLIGMFGQEVPATGFALDVEAVADCLEQPRHARPETLVWYELSALDAAKAVVAAQPEGTAVLSCGDTVEAAKQEAAGLGSRRLMLVYSDRTEEVLL